MKQALAALLVAYAIFATMLVATVREMPLQLASHFDAAGHANGWMNRDSYVELISGTAAGLPFLFIGIALGAGQLRLGSYKIPNRDYWLAAERRPGTVRIMLSYMIVFSALIVLFFAGLHVLVFAANLDATHPQLSSAGISVLTGLFLVATGIWALSLYRRFLHIGPKP